jgi:3'(2'), 5'-bisphosphate nucleotidase
LGTTPIDAAFVEAVRQIALRAGEAILDVYRSDFAVECKDDRSPVTEADRRAETLILDALRRDVTDAFPIVAEEEVAAGRLPQVGEGPFWLVDPLDGTKQFVERKGEFTVNIALIEHRRPVLGVVHAPAIAATWWASPLGAFATTDGGPAAPIACRPVPEKGLVAVASRSHRNAETDAFLARYDIGEAISSGSSIKFCLVASGRADLYPRTGRTMEWDTAAGHAVVRFAGGSVTDMQGDELVYGKPGFDNPHFVVWGRRVNGGR